MRTAPDPRSTTPTTQVNRRPAVAGGVRAEETPFRVSHIAVAWRGADARVRLRMPQGWTRWHALGRCGGARDGQPADAPDSVLLSVAGAEGYEVLVDPASTVEVTELNTVGSANAAAAPADGLPLPDGSALAVPYLSRAAWEADETLRFTNGTETWPAEYFPVQTLTVHHTAGANDDPDPAATIRAIYFFQAITQGWGDVGYNLFIDEAGRVYEGRWSGTDGVPGFGGAAGREVVTGGHVETFNSGNVGVCLLGDFTSRNPTAAARATLTMVLAGLARSCGLDPTATVTYVNPNTGNARTVQTISGHRDWAATQCPGNLFYPHLPEIRGAVAAGTPSFAVVSHKPRPSGVVPIPRKPSPF
jgi:hypothetical protein